MHAVSDEFRREFTAFVNGMRECGCTCKVVLSRDYHGNDVYKRWEQPDCKVHVPNKDKKMNEHEHHGTEIRFTICDECAAMQRPDGSWDQGRPWKEVKDELGIESPLLYKCPTFGSSVELERIQHYYDKHPLPSE